MIKTMICLDNDECVWTEMCYSDALNLLTNNEAAFVEFTNLNGHKEAISPAHVVEVYEAHD